MFKFNNPFNHSANNSNSEINNSPRRYYAGAVSEFDDEPLPIVETQRHQQIRIGLKGLGALTLAIGIGFGAGAIHIQRENDLQIEQVQALAAQIALYHPEIENELAKATSLATQIGDQVAVPGVAHQFSMLRETAGNVLAAEIPSAARGTKPADVVIQREVAEGMLAVNSSLVSELQNAESQMNESHLAYLRDQSGMVVASAALAVPIAEAQAVLDASYGIESTSARVELQEALDRANAAVEQASVLNQSADDYAAATEESRQANDNLQAQILYVKSLMPGASVEEELPLTGAANPTANPTTSIAAEETAAR